MRLRSMQRPYSRHIYSVCFLAPKDLCYSLQLLRHLVFYVASRMHQDQCNPVYVQLELAHLPHTQLFGHVDR